MNEEPQVLYCDAWLMAIDKPAGMIVHGDGTGERTLTDYASDLLLAMGDGFAATDMQPLNRLDRNTSGLVAAGCSLAGLQKLSAMFKDRSLHKYYLCVVSGSVREKKRIEGFLKKDEKTNQVTISQRELPDSAPICTRTAPV